MSKNKGKSRKGAIKLRSQTYNLKTKLFVKRDKTCILKLHRCKGVRKEKNCKKN